MNGTYHVIEPHEEGTPEKREYHGAEESTNEAFHSLLRRQFDKGCTSKCYTPNVCEDIIANDERRGNPEPNQSFKDVVDNEVTANRLQWSIKRAGTDQQHTSRQQS